MKSDTNRNGVARSAILLDDVQLSSDVSRKRTRPFLQTGCRCLTAATLFAAVLFAVPPQSALSQTVELVTVDVKAIERGYRTSKLKGTDVTNDQNEKIGSIDDIIVGQDRAVYAVLQVGGFLGVGGRLVAVPFQSLVLDDKGRKIQLPGATRDALKKLPIFEHAS